MKLIKAERPLRYTGPIEECPNKEVTEVPEANSEDLFEQVYANWSDEFFKRHPRGKLTCNGFLGKKLVVRGTGDNGFWLVAWWLEENVPTSG
jgi:hypothetical protein